MQHVLADDLKYEYSYLHHPVAQVQPGETFQVSTEDGFSARFRCPEQYSRENVAWVQQNLCGVTGPIAVDGAQPGQVVAICIEAVEVVTPGSVVLSRYSYPSPEDWWLEEVACTSYPVEEGEIVFNSRRIPIRPLIGCLATAPAREVILSKREGPYGGNMDCNEITAGATVVLPVAVPGAYLYFGDCKARMADGEIVQPPEVGCLITVTVELRPAPANMSCPRVETVESLMTVVSAGSLEAACRDAFKYMLLWLEDEYAMERQEAAQLMGLVAHTGVCQVTNTFYTAKCTMPRTFMGVA